MLINNVAAVDEGRQSIEHRVQERYVPSRIKIQFRVGRQTGCELVNRNPLTRRSDEMSNSESL